MFVCLITNESNQKIYVGKWAGKAVLDRWRLHLWEVRRGSGTAIHNAIRKYGCEAFSISILAETNTMESLNNLERLWICVLDTRNRKIGYNISAGGDGASYPRSQETRDKMSVANRARFASPDFLKQQSEHCRRISILPKYFSQETRQVMSSHGRQRTGEKRSEQAKANMRAARLRFFETEKGKAEKEKLRANKGNGNLGGVR